MNVHTEKGKNNGNLLITCPEKPGIISSVSNFLTDHGANVIQFDQHSTNPKSGMFFMRIEFYMENLKENYDKLEEDLHGLAEEHEIEWNLSSNNQKKRMAIFVSKEGHCLRELLWRWKSGEIAVEIPMVISNHPDLREEVEALGIPYYHIPVTPETKGEAEKQMLEIMKDKVDFIALARYMQILSPDFVGKYHNKVLNIHHSFLPAFIGANPYVRAFNRGVKLIGATAHFVTNDLDEGPIIEQDVERVSHRYTADNLKVAGRHVEKQVFATAVTWFVDNKVIVHGNKTVVFT